MFLRVVVFYTYLKMMTIIFGIVRVVSIDIMR